MATILWFIWSLRSVTVVELLSKNRMLVRPKNAYEQSSINTQRSGSWEVEAVELYSTALHAEGSGRGNTQKAASNLYSRLQA